MYFHELVSSYDAERRERNIFHDLMRYRVREILLVSSLYDSFIVESDGVLAEQIYGEYFALNLTSAPRVSCAYDDEAAERMYESGDYDMVILMAGLDFEGPLELAARLKAKKAGVPILLLATNNSSLALLGDDCAALSAVDRVFVWNGYSKLFVGMIKYVEDLRNVDADTNTGLVRVILLIEDSVRYYSRYLPLLYAVVMRQTQQLIEEEHLFETTKILRMRARPKVLIATTYEEAVELFERYRPYLLTVISDVRFPLGGKVDPEAGFKFVKMAREEVTDLPVMIQSSELEARGRAYALGARFADKNSNSLEAELIDFMRENLGFGGFEFRSPVGDVLGRANNMCEFTELLRTVPAETLEYHASRNHFSAWLLARGEIQFARIVRNYRVDDFKSAEDMRDFILRTLDDLRRAKSRGGIPNFDEAAVRDRNAVSRLGGGSIGGKGRGIAFIRSLLDNVDFERFFRGIDVRIPPTAFIGIDEFEQFLTENALWDFAYYEGDWQEVKARFFACPLPQNLVDRLVRFLAVAKGPIAVRSSGLFEDMLLVPFSGIYSTYLIPNASSDPRERLVRLCDAIKLTYASLFSHGARDYFEASRYKIEEERMAVVLQEVVGRRVGRWYYPHMSGTAQSYNWYPVSYVKAEDGLCVAAYGLGAYVVGGGAAFRFCPKFPKVELMSLEQRLARGQHQFLALDMEKEADLRMGEEASLELLDLSEAEADPAFFLAASTLDLNEGRLVPGVSEKGPRVVDFANVLKYGRYPIADAIALVLEIGAKAMGTPVEIEYAVDFGAPGDPPTLYLLQIKPLIQQGEKVDVELGEAERALCLLASDRAMGNGADRTVRDVVFVDPGRFDRGDTERVARDVGAINELMKEEGRKYVLIGPGRWGTRDRWLGVPVSFSQISNARVIVEADLPGFQVDSSLGSHFFHNVTSMNIGYFSVSLSSARSFVDWEWLSSLPVERSSGAVTHVALDEPLEILMDGKKSKALVKKRASGPKGDC
jgi:hypothetical protein